MQTHSFSSEKKKVLNQPDILPTSAENIIKKKKREMNNSQQGFVRNKLCQTNLISFCDRITYLMDTAEPQTVIFLIKAFDSVSYNMLISKLAKHVEMKLLKVDAKMIRKLYSKSCCWSLSFWSGNINIFINDLDEKTHLLNLPYTKQAGRASKHS